MFGRNSNQGFTKGFRPPLSAVPNPVLQGAGCGLVEGTLVATETGWRPVDTLRVGDTVLTFDGGLQPVVALIRDEIWGGSGPCPSSLWPLFVAAGVIGNRDDMLVMPHQGVLIESDSICDKWGDPFAVVPGAALEVLDGVERHEPYGTVEVVLPVFEEDNMVFADNGALLFCQSHWGVSAGILPKHGVAGNYNMLPLQKAMQLLEVTVMSDVLDYAVSVA